MNDKLSAEAVLEDQELIQKFLKETTLFLGPDQEIMQSHDIMPITDREKECVKKYDDPHQMASIRDRMQSACDESYEMLEQMGAAPGAKWGDVITGIYSASGDLTIGSAGGVLIFNVVVHHPIKFIIKNWINEHTVGLKQGDGFIHNDSRYGNVHNTDQSMIMPIFHEGELVAWVASTVHEGENGAIEPGGMPSMAESPFDEGLKMSPFRVIENYEIKKDLLTFLQNSVREPKLQYEDMKVKLFACMRLEKRLREILAVDGPEALISCLRSTNDDVMTEVRRRIKEWPDMTVRTYCTMDSTLRENALIKLNCTLTKKDDRLIFDLRGSSPEITNRAINTAVPGCKGMMSQAFLNHIWPDLPRGQAGFAPIEVITPPYSIVNASVNAPNSQSLMSIFLSFTVAQQAAAKFLYSVPVKYTRVLAPWFNMICTYIWGGVSQHGEMLGNLCADLNGMGGGARMDMDGEHALAPIFASMADIGEQEMNEEDVPFLQLVSKKMTTNTQAPGKYRGGMGFETLRMVHNSADWCMFFMGNGYMNSDWGLHGGYPSAVGYRFEAHETGLHKRIAEGKSLPMGHDWNPDEPDFENHLEPGAKVKRDNQCITTEEIFENGDLYLNYLRGGPGFGDPLDRTIENIQKDLNDVVLLEEYAVKIYGAVFTKDAEGYYTVDADATKARQKEMRQERLSRGTPVKEWMKGERELILDKKASPQVQQMYASSFEISQPFLDKFRAFWDLPSDWLVTEKELGVPAFGAKHHMDLSQMPDVKTVVLVEE